MTQIEKWLVKARHPEWGLDVLVGALLDPSSAVVITGFWRSGTTWILQSIARALQAKSVFEPFHYDIDGYRNALLNDFDLPRSDGEYVNMYMPYCGDSLSPCPFLRVYLKSSLTGRITEPWVRGARRENRMQKGRGSEWKLLDVPYRLREALKTRVVTKFVRGHLLIPALNEEYDSTVIHIRRDPRAVIASFDRLGWTWYEDLSLEDQLLAPGDGRSEYFEDWEEMIQHYENADPLVRVAAYWALVERFVADLPSSPNRSTVSYEHLCLDPEKTLTGTFGDLRDKAHAEHFGKTSRTTEEERTRATKRERILGWQNTLTERISKEAEEICERLGLENSLFKREDLQGDWEKSKQV